MEPQTAIATTGSSAVAAVAAWHAALGGKELVVKLLGPTADYLGGELKSGIQKGTDNIKRIFASAVKKVGVEIDSPAVVAPKVLHKILEDGFFIDDEVSAEYFGGVLASSRVSQERDDRGAYWLSVLGRLSTFQIRAHCVLYMGLHSSLKQCPKPTEEFQKIMNAKKGLAINSSDLSHCLKLNGTEDDSGILAHVYSGLQRERLINDVQKTNGLPEMAVTFSEDGVALLLWAFGMGKKPLAAFLNNSLPWPNITSVISGSLVVPPRKGDEVASN